MFDSKNLQHWIFSLKYIAKFAHKVDFRNSLEAFWGLHFRDGATVGKGWQVVMRRAAAAQRGFLFCQDLGGQCPPAIDAPGIEQAKVKPKGVDETQHRQTVCVWKA